MSCNGIACVSQVMTMMVPIGYDMALRHGIHLDSGYEIVLEVVASYLANWLGSMKYYMLPGWSQDM
jgi:hypothetical protein